MTKSDCYSIISDCIEHGLKTEFDNLTSYDKREVEDFFRMLMDVYDDIENFQTRWLKD